jgi:hypothetical protein
MDLALDDPAVADAVDEYLLNWQPAGSPIGRPSWLAFPPCVTS